ncbi:MAG: glycoside hydrolase family 43 protein [Eubacterium sp.]
MKLTEINIRDPFVLFENNKYYLYGTRAKNFGKFVDGFDVYISDNLIDFSKPYQCFDSEKYGLNNEVCWAPEVHKYDGSYYMLATFTGKNGLRGTYILKSDSPEGPFVPHSNKPLTPEGWECLDGTLYIDRNGDPYLIFCHEHTQIIDGTICYVRLNDDLTNAISEPIELFAASQPYYIEKLPEGEHYITDGPFMYRTKNGELLLIWSTFINDKYAQCIAKSDNGEITGKFVHLPPLITDDGGHGMIFKANDKLLLTFHSPNKTNFERPIFKELEDTGETIKLK